MELDFQDLFSNEKEDFFKYHELNDVKPTKTRVVVGWYVKGQHKVKFYKKPSFMKRFNMRIIFGWKWEDAKG